MGDKSTMIGGITDKVSICPVMDQIVPEKHFYDFRAAHGRGGALFPTHYVINDWGRDTAEQVVPGGTDTPRVTKPPYYFGFSYHSASQGEDVNTPPVAIAQIPKAPREWMLADAWYRPRDSVPGLPQQEGPFQTPWTGEALPNFAPHMRRGSSSYTFENKTTRQQQSGRIRQAGLDGLTNTAFFDGHASSEKSVRLEIQGWEILYGFRGTVNPDPELETWPGAGG
jgi:prepilin-type processing-associated H-X9-DG protein